MKIKLWTMAPLLLIFFVSLFLPLIWLKQHLTINYLESGFFYFLGDPYKILNITLYNWWDFFGLGANNPFSVAFIIYNIFNLLLKILGLAAVSRQYIIFVLILG